MPSQITKEQRILKQQEHINPSVDQHTSTPASHQQVTPSMLASYTTFSLQTASALSSADSLDSNKSLSDAMVSFMVLVFVVVALLLAVLAFVVYKLIISPSKPPQNQSAPTPAFPPTSPTVEMSPRANAQMMSPMPGISVQPASPSTMPMPTPVQSQPPAVDPNQMASPSAGGPVFVPGQPMPAATPSASANIAVPTDQPVMSPATGPVFAVAPVPEGVASAPPQQ